MSREEEDSAVADSFWLPEEGPADPRPIVARLIEECPEFSDLRIGRPRFFTIFAAAMKVKGGRQTIGTMGLPRFQGATASFALFLLAQFNGGEVPDFILTIDSPWWELATPEQQEALVHHELCHCEHARDRDGELKFDDEGLPVWAIKAHDLEEFNLTVRRYGAWKEDVVAFRAALDSHGKPQ